MKLRDLVEHYDGGINVVDDEDGKSICFICTQCGNTEWWVENIGILESTVLCIYHDFDKITVYVKWEEE